VVGSNPCCGDHFFKHYSFGSKPWKQKLSGKLAWHCWMCCNPANGRVEFEDVWLIKPSFITMDEMKACQLTRTKSSPPQKKKKINKKNNQNQNNFCVRKKCGRTLALDGQYWLCWRHCLEASMWSNSNHKKTLSDCWTLCYERVSV